MQVVTGTSCGLNWNECLTSFDAKKGLVLVKLIIFWSLLTQHDGQEVSEKV